MTVELKAETKYESEKFDLIIFDCGLIKVLNNKYCVSKHFNDIEDAKDHLRKICQTRIPNSEKDHGYASINKHHALSFKNITAYITEL